MYKHEYLSCPCGAKRRNNLIEVCWVRSDGSTMVRIQCRKCRFTSPFGRDREEAIDNWNAAVKEAMIHDNHQ